jgi:hypothetical protein
MQGPSGLPAPPDPGLDRGWRIGYIAVMIGREESRENRAARLAEALRENLRRRKAQARARREAGEPGAAGGGPADGSDVRNGSAPAAATESRGAEHTSRATDDD